MAAGNIAIASHTSSGILCTLCIADVSILRRSHRAHIWRRESHTFNLDPGHTFNLDALAPTEGCRNLPGYRVQGTGCRNLPKARSRFFAVLSLSTSKLTVELQLAV